MKSRIWCFGDDVDTDQIIPARFLVTTDSNELGAAAFADARPGFAAGVSEGEILVAGKNFGCGSSREHAPIALRGAGIRVVIAASFARIFFRNAINTGLSVLECPEAVAALKEGDLVEVDLGMGTIGLPDGRLFQAIALDQTVADIVLAGGLLAFVRHELEKQ